MNDKWHGTLARWFRVRIRVNVFAIVTSLSLSLYLVPCSYVVTSSTLPRFLSFLWPIALWIQIPSHQYLHGISVCVCVRACARACVRAHVRACVCVRVSMYSMLCWTCVYRCLLKVTIKPVSLLQSSLPYFWTLPGWCQVWMGTQINILGNPSRQFACSRPCDVSRSLPVRFGCEWRGLKLLGEARFWFKTLSRGAGRPIARLCRWRSGSVKKSHRVNAFPVIR